MSLIRTFTGRNFDFANPTLDMFNIKDIAYGLANEKRYCNQTWPLFSVGQHSIFVSYLLEIVDASFTSDEAIFGLIHDVIETYMRDLPSPLKKLEALKAFSEKEDELHGLLCIAFGINNTTIRFDRIKQADLEARSYEKMFLQGEWVEGFQPQRKFVNLFKNIVKWSPLETEMEFIARYLFLRAKS